jgi:hypothetical protein
MITTSLRIERQCGPVVCLLAKPRLASSLQIKQSSAPKSRSGHAIKHTEQTATFAASSCHFGTKVHRRSLCRKADRWIAVPVVVEIDKKIEQYRELLHSTTDQAEVDRINQLIVKLYTDRVRLHQNP